MALLAEFFLSNSEADQRFLRGLTLHGVVKVGTIQRRSVCRRCRSRTTRLLDYGMER